MSLEISSQLIIESTVSQAPVVFIADENIRTPGYPFINGVLSFSVSNLIDDDCCGTEEEAADIFVMLVQPLSGETTERPGSVWITKDELTK
ncbi:hypothetical protein BBP40_001271 [Aspergillus hancockii]|nr:hypothetical protein BBP40_001271 [Aspergillus hancockii]